MASFMDELHESLEGRKRLQELFGKKGGNRLADLACRLASERASSVPDFMEWMLMDGLRGNGWESVYAAWESKITPKKMVDDD